jgi:hypothetical protein
MKQEFYIDFYLINEINFKKVISKFKRIRLNNRMTLIEMINIAKKYIKKKQSANAFKIIKQKQYNNTIKETPLTPLLKY